MNDAEIVKQVEDKLDGKKNQYRVYIENQYPGLIEAFSEKEAEEIVEKKLNQGRYEDPKWVSRVELEE